jgi:large subunit ribosomal protein L5
MNGTERETTEAEVPAEATVPVAETEAEPAAEGGAEPKAQAEPTEEAAAEPTAEAEPVAAPDAEPEAPKAARAPKTARSPAPGKGTRAAAVAEPADDATAGESAAAPAAPSGPRGLKLRYAREVVPALVKQFEYANPNQVPKLEKIIVNVGLGEALSNAKAIDAATGDIVMITGQKPIVTRARRSIAQFKIRTGNPIGLKVTLRGQRMWDFLERLTLLTLPRIRDFRGVPSKSFDGRGNYSLGMREQIAFPEIDYDKVDRLRGLEVSIVTTAKSDEESKRLLELLGMPFAG